MWTENPSFVVLPLYSCAVDMPPQGRNHRLFWLLKRLYRFFIESESLLICMSTRFSCSWATNISILRVVDSKCFFFLVLIYNRSNHIFGCFLRLYRFFSQSESLCICNTRDFMIKSRCLLGKSNNSVYRERAHSRAVLLESSCWWQLSELFISGEDGVLQLRVVNSAVHQFSWWKREFLRNSLINRNILPPF